MKPIAGWCGVTDSTIEIELWPKTANDAYCRIYQTQSEALKHYECVVKVMVVAVDDPSEAKNG